MTTSGDLNGKHKRDWELSVGIYPGFLFGVRTYQETDRDTHIFYLPFINILLTIFK